jgi:hypothetical protein
MIAAEIARALGGRWSGAWWSCRCPAHDDRSPSLSIRDGDRRLIVRCWGGCDPRDVLAELRRRGLLDGPAEYRPLLAPVVRADDSVRQIKIAGRIWDAAGDARGSPVAAYIAARGISLSPPCTLRYAPSLRRPDCLGGGDGPAMVARIDGPDSELYGVHRTWIERDAAGIWRRRDRAMLGRAAGGAVRFAPAAETLLVAEGHESTLAVMQATGLPGWAALSASGIERLILPAAVRDVLIAADHDESGVGLRAAEKAAARWRAEGRRVWIFMSPRVGEDAADLIRMVATESCDAA